MADQDARRTRRGDRTGASIAEDPPGRAGSSDGGGASLVRVTVNLTPRSMQALEQVSTAVGESKTDAINRALQVYAFLRDVLERESATLMIKHPDGEVERLRFIM